MTLALFILVFLAGFAFVEFVFFATAHRGDAGARARQRLRRIASSIEAGSPAQEASILRALDDGSPSGLRHSLGEARALDPLRLLLYRAGSRLGVAGFFGLCCAAAVGGGFAGGLLLEQPALGVMLAVTGGLLPIFVVIWRKRARMRRFEAMLPDALDLLARALRAGHALSAGLQMVGDELEDPVGPEFARISEEVRLGLEMSVALEHLAERIDVSEMPFFVTALVIQRETGGNLAEIIDNLARVMRSRQAMNGKIRAVTAQTRWSANLLLIAPFAFAIGMSVLRPSYVEPLWKTEAGRSLVAVASVMVIAGWLLCRRLGVVRV